MLARYFLSLLIILLFLNCFSQKFKMEIGAGVINYQGDLQPVVVTFNLSRPAACIFVKYEFAGNLILRTGLTSGNLYATDKQNRDYLQFRNLDFRTKISEIQCVLEYYPFSLQKNKFSPYIFLGVAGYHFNLYTFDNTGAKIYLHPLSTEGEGLPEYPERKKYKLTQAAIPFGAGIAYKINCNSTLSLELCQRKLFTDYLDDVSLTYVDYNMLLNEKGPKAVELAYRGNQLTGVGTYPLSGKQRGNPKQNDWYYTGLLKFSFNLVKCETGNSIFGNLLDKIIGGKRKFKNSTKCPRNVY